MIFTNPCVIQFICLTLEGEQFNACVTLLPISSACEISWLHLLYL